MKTNRLVLFREAIAVCCENRTGHTDTVRISQEMHCVSATKTNLNSIIRLVWLSGWSDYQTNLNSIIRLVWSDYQTNLIMLFRRTFAVYCENYTEHTDTVRTSHETHYFSATKSNRLMLFEETVPVYCENHTEHTNTIYGQNAEFSFCLQYVNKAPLLNKNPVFSII
jgi:hypothetical protein